MKTPRRKHYKSTKYSSDVYNRESGPLEIGELETPRDRRSVPVATLRYLAGSKYQTNNAEGSCASENSDYTDARSVESETDPDGPAPYYSERSIQRSNKSSHKSSDLKTLNFKTSKSNNPNTSNNFAREFILRYATNLGSDVQYYQNYKPPQESPFHNMDYIHAHLSSFNPNFINFNYGRVGYTTYNPLINRYPDYCPTYINKYSSSYVNRYQDYGYARPENHYRTNYSYCNRHGNFHGVHENYLERPTHNLSMYSNNYHRLNHNMSTTDYRTNVNYSVSDYGPNCSQIQNDHKYYLDKYGYPLDNQERERNYIEDSAKKTSDHETKESKDHREREYKYNNKDDNSKDYECIDSEAIKAVVEKAVIEAFDKCLSEKIKGEETCLTDSVNREYTFDKNDTTLTYQEQSQLYSRDYLQRLTNDQNNQGTSDMNRYGKNDFKENNENDTHGLKPFEKDFSNVENREYSKDKTVESNNFEFKREDNFQNSTAYANTQENPYVTDHMSQNVYEEISYENKTDEFDSESFNFQFNKGSQFEYNFDGVDLFSNRDQTDSLFYPDEEQFNSLNNNVAVRDDFAVGEMYDKEQQDNFSEQLTNQDDKSELLCSQTFEGNDLDDKNFDQTYTLGNCFANFNSSRDDFFRANYKDLNMSNNLAGSMLSESDLEEVDNNMSHKAKSFYPENSNYLECKNPGENIGPLSKQKSNTLNAPQRKMKASPKMKNMSQFIEEKQTPDSTTSFRTRNNFNLLCYKNLDERRGRELHEASYKYQPDASKTVRSSFSDPLYRINSPYLKPQTADSESNQPEYAHDYNSDISNFKKSQSGMSQDSHISARVDQLEECIKSFESSLKNISEQLNKSRKKVESSPDSTYLELTSSQKLTKPDHVSELEYMEAYKAASAIKKLLHVKSMGSLIPAFTAFVQNRKG
ncbi:Spm2 protein [Theileria annulata]|uniref:Spm2 protein n=1 Tax=Theileria annulata TaxID=5874 RepID=Q4UDM5_THEAN|nr:Spm2 protein [Theileria annulata]CAI74814.1 Spm2 protein [Theileria annulata]|eukprot:XP_952546.1 Spm2 protein [Theileria annulata]